MKILMEILKKTPLFRNMDEDEINSALSFLAARQAAYEKNSFIFSLDSNSITTEIGPGAFPSSTSAAPSIAMNFTV